MGREGQYATLLANPCTGPLVHAPGSTEGGQVVRFESDYIIGNGVGITAGYFMVTPGAINASASANGFGVLSNASADDSASSFPSSGGIGTYVPGYNFLQTNASSYRCIAACVQVYWPGSELNRAGVVSAAQGTYGLLNTGQAVSPSTLRSISPVVERMPSDYMEAKWAPNYSDGLFRNPSSASPPEDGHASLLITWAGLPVTTGVRIRVVCVYEWRPKVFGLVLSSNTSMSSAGEVQAVRKMLDKRDANWWNKTGQAAFQFVSGLTVAYATRRAGSYADRVEL